MSEHTPGPWRRSWTIVTAADGSPIADCEIRRSTQPDGGDHALDREIEANARLIAAAPELLDSLEDMADFLKESLGMFDGYGNYDDATFFVDRARAAIAKAKGIQQ